MEQAEIIPLLKEIGFEYVFDGNIQFFGYELRTNLYIKHSDVYTEHYTLYGILPSGWALHSIEIGKMTIDELKSFIETITTAWERRNKMF